MKKIIYIKYNSIFKYETHKETVKYQEIGTYEETSKGIYIRFKTKETNIEIRILKDTVWLTNGSSTLQLITGKRVKNSYPTMYGTIYIDTFMENFENTGNIKIKYQLLDQEICISKNYILLQITEKENENT